MSFAGSDLSTLDKASFYKALALELRHLCAGESDALANLANVAALLNHHLRDVNWVGFYLHKDAQLIVGPFQGKPACVRIAIGRGVCGQAAKRLETIVVPDVHAFEDHIACDSASQSEIVVPLIRDGRLLGVLDIDSPIVNRFDQDDAAGLNACVEALLAVTEPETLLT
jgi:L-methionine (R)-S-oxide reductase